MNQTGEGLLGVGVPGIGQAVPGVVITRGLVVIDGVVKQAGEGVQLEGGPGGGAGFFVEAEVVKRGLRGGDVALPGVIVEGPGGGFEVVGVGAQAGADEIELGAEASGAVEQAEIVLDQRRRPEWVKRIAVELDRAIGRALGFGE
jgi:hypothetical protein